MRLFRSHALGNDYLVLEEGILTPEVIRALCDRHEGIGADGVLEPAPGNGADYGLRIHNPDGTEAEKSGNGLRIYADWLVRAKGAPSTFTVWTPGGVVKCDVGPLVRVAMGTARVLGAETLADTEVIRVDIGNPHAVVEGIPTDWEDLGAEIEVSVPDRTNVQFVERVDGSTLRVRVWERGAGRTRSSGSSACAAAMVGVARGWVTSPVRVEMEGGALTVSIFPDGRVELLGPVEPVGRIEVETPWLNRRLPPRLHAQPAPPPKLPDELAVPRYGGREYSASGLGAGLLFGIGFAVVSGNIFVGLAVGITMALALGAALGKKST